MTKSLKETLSSRRIELMKSREALRSLDRELKDEVVKCYLSGMLSFFDDRITSVEKDIEEYRQK